jgi:hypothetical protein
MRIKDYTADSICRLMGFPSLVEESWKQRDQPTVRAVLTPSFHPELCLTLMRESDGSACLNVAAFRHQLWLQFGAEILSYRLKLEALIGKPLPDQVEGFRQCDREDVSISLASAVELEQMFRCALENMGPGRGHLCVDGMGTESCLASCDEQLMLNSSAHDPHIQPFIVRLIDLAWQNSRTPRVRNSLAYAGSYVGLKCPEFKIPTEEPPMRIAVLGAPEARQEYFEQLRRAKDV